MLEVDDIDESIEDDDVDDFLEDNVALASGKRNTSSERRESS